MKALQRADCHGWSSISSLQLTSLSCAYQLCFAQLLSEAWMLLFRGGANSVQLDSLEVILHKLNLNRVYARVSTSVLSAELRKRHQTYSYLPHMAVTEKWTINTVNLSNGLPGFSVNGSDTVQVRFTRWSFSQVIRKNLVQTKFQAFHGHIWKCCAKWQNSDMSCPHIFSLPRGTFLKSLHDRNPVCFFFFVCYFPPDAADRLGQIYKSTGSVGRTTCSLLII